MTTNSITWGDCDIAGTSLQGYLDSPYGFEETVARLKALSGQDPTEGGDGYKVSVEFVGQFNGQPFTLYDYKGDNEIHIGGRDKRFVPALQKALVAAMASVVPAAYTATLHYDETEGQTHGFEMAPATKRWVGCPEADRLLTQAGPLPTTQRDLIEKHTGLLYASWRKLRAATGFCPDCGGEMSVDPECVVSDPPHGSMDHRTAPAAMCNTCDCCEEL